MSRPSSRLRVGAVLACLALSGCGDDKPGVAITEADPVAERPESTVDTSALALPDSVLADSVVLADTAEVVVADSIAPPPDFIAFWTGFQAAIRSGNVGAVTGYARLGEEGIGLTNVDQAYIRAFTDPFRAAVLELSPRDFERDSLAREIRVVVGYDANGRPVPEDEADTEEAIRLRFDVIDDRYRWVGFQDDA